MKKLLLLFVVSLSLSTFTQACKGRDKSTPTPTVYSNDAFSIELPKGWKYDDSKWGGPDSITNEVNFYNKESNIRFVFVKEFLPTSVLDITTVSEAARLSIYQKEEKRMEKGSAGQGDDGYIGVFDYGDSWEINGYPTKFIGLKYKERDDTVMNAQYVVLIPQEHRMFFLNAYCYQSDIKAGRVDAEFLDNFLYSVKFKYSREGERNGDAKEFLEKYKDILAPRLGIKVDTHKERKSIQQTCLI